MYLARMRASLHPPGFEQIRREELGRVFQRLFVVRRRLQPVLLLLMLSVVLSDVRSWRSILIMSAPLIAILVTLAESQRLKQRGLGKYTPSRDFLAFVLIIPIASLCTGGV